MSGIGCVRIRCDIPHTARPPCQFHSSNELEGMFSLSSSVFTSVNNEYAEWGTQHWFKSSYNCLSYPLKIFFFFSFLLMIESKVMINQEVVINIKKRLSQVLQPNLYIHIYFLIMVRTSYNRNLFESHYEWFSQFQVFLSLIIVELFKWYIHIYNIKH